MQPNLRAGKTRNHAITTFKGLCRRSTVPEGYFADTENLSSTDYPALTPRGKRGLINDTSGITSMFMHNEMVWAEGIQLYYGSSLVGTVSAYKKQFVSLGSKVIIYPDKLCLDTETLSLTSLNRMWSGAGVSVIPSNADGSPATDATYVKISGSGIGTGFAVGDGVTLSGFSTNALNGKFILQTVQTNYIVVIATVAQSFSETGSITVLRYAPNLDYLCAHGNRIWGCRADGHEIYACKLGDPTNWDCFEGISTDSYVASVPSPGAFTGLTSNLGNVIFFKEDEIIKLYGSKPSNFQLVSSRMPGIAPGASASLAFTDSTLFYQGEKAVYAYDGSTPVCISQALGDICLANGCAGTFDGRYYLSALNTYTNSWEFLVYDTSTGTWQRENGGQARFFVSTGSDLYFALTDGKIYSVGRSGLWYEPSLAHTPRLHLNEQIFSWYAETAALPLTLPNRHYVSRLHLRFSLSNGASFSVLTRTSQADEWQTVKTFTGPLEEVTFTIPLHARRASSIYLRLQGSNACVIKAINFAYEVGGDV